MRRGQDPNSSRYKLFLLQQQTSRETKKSNKKT
jgi:hypothetical protein